MVDSHAHLTFQWSRPGQKSYTTEEQLIAAEKAGLSRIMNIMVEEDLDSSIFHKINSINNTSVKIDWAFGLHPEEYELQNETKLKEKIRKYREFIAFNLDKIQAIGEGGLDYYDTKASKEEQIELFTLHIELANQYDKPLIIHTRPSSLQSDDAYLDMLAVLKGFKPQSSFVMHCFCSSYKMAKKFLDLGGYIGLAGNLTYPNARNIHEVAEKAPLERLLTETDSPFLAPQKYRGQISQPAYVKEVLLKLAELRKISFSEIEDETEANYIRFIEGK